MIGTTTKTNSDYPAGPLTDHMWGAHIQQLGQAARRRAQMGTVAAGDILAHTYVRSRGPELWLSSGVASVGANRGLLEPLRAPLADRTASGAFASVSAADATLRAFA